MQKDFVAVYFNHDHRAVLAPMVPGTGTDESLAIVANRMF